MFRNGGESGIGVHGVKLGVGVGVAGGSGGEHSQGESGGHGRRDAIFVGYELEGSSTAAGFEGVVDLLEQANVGGTVEVVEEVGEKDDVVWAGEVDVEGRAGEHVVAVLNAGFLGVFEGDAKDWSPVEAGDMGMGVLFGDLDAKEAVAGGDVEDTHGASTAIKNQFAERACQGAHHGGHIIGEFNPEGVFGLDRAAAGERSAASANDFGELVVDAFNVGIRQKEGDGGNAGWRGGVEERGARGGVVVVTVLFGEDTADAEEVAEDANAALGGGGVLGDGGYVVMAPADGAEDIELDSGLESGGVLIGRGQFEDKAGVGGGCGIGVRGHR